MSTFAFLVRLIPLAAGMSALLTAAPGALAATEQATQEARGHARKATTAYNMGNFREAAKHYEAAYRLFQDPNLLFNIAQSHRQAGQNEKALAAYKGFLRTSPRNHPNRKQAAEHVAQLEASADGKPEGEPARQADDETPPAPKNDEFNPFASDEERERSSYEEVDEGGEISSENVIRRTNPTAGAMVMYGDQLGVLGGPVGHFQVFARVALKGLKFEAGYFDLPLFLPNPKYSTSAVYFRFTSAQQWWVQGGALGKNGNFHAAGGMDWGYLGASAWLENVGGTALCSDSSGKATYISPQLYLRIPVIKGITARAEGLLRQKLFVTDVCAFTPSMASFDAGLDWALGEQLIFNGGLGMFQFFNLNGTAQVWGSYSDTFVPQAFLGARYQWRKHIAFVATYRRIFYTEGVNNLMVNLEASLGQL